MQKRFLITQVVLATLVILLMKAGVFAQRVTPEQKECEAKGFKWAFDATAQKSGCYNPADYTLKYPRVVAPKWKKTGGVRTATLDISDLQDITSNAQGHLFVGVYNEGLYVSRDNGATYQEVSVPAKGWKEENVTVECLHFTKEGVLFAGSDPYGIYRSKNNGDTWQNLGTKNGLPEFEAVHQIISLPGGILFASVEDNGIFRSKDNGEKWARVTLGLPDKFDERKCMMTANDAGEVFIFAEETNIENERGVYVSADKGDSWTMVTDIAELNKSFLLEERRDVIRLQSI
ncbi:MAG TPA: hypothetical protein VEB86_05495, partial [Chryseosolibacter sp.]|nr:hypothetical protein [Chryseosolibacter sp.]